MKKRNSVLLTILGIFLIVGGLTIVALPYLNNMALKEHSKEVTQITIEEVDVKTIETNKLEEGIFDYDAITNIEATKTLLNRPDYNKDQIIGQLYYPDLKINLSLFNTLSDGNLLAGVTTMKPKQVMGEGNYAIAGHYTNGKDTLFNQLPNAQIGQIIRLTDKTTIYEYKVIDLKKVDASALYMINDSLAKEYDVPSDHILSLMSCYYYETDYRWFVIGQLEKTYPYTLERLLNG